MLKTSAYVGHILYFHTDFKLLQHWNFIYILVAKRRLRQPKDYNYCNKTNSDIRLRNLGAERIHNSETVSLPEENSNKNIWAHERKSNMEN
jgi:hypothetical protein